MSDARTVRPTKKQRELLEYIKQFIDEHGYSPSYREIMRGLKYTSVATVSLHVNSLIRRGHLHKRDYSARSLELASASSSRASTGAGASSNASDARQADGASWLVEMVKARLALAEASSSPSAKQLADLRTLLASLEILGLAEASQAIAPRLAALEGGRHEKS
jgi:hypothetical protein